jgi:hypothetical protein
MQPTGARDPLAACPSAREVRTSGPHRGGGLTEPPGPRRRLRTRQTCPHAQPAAGSRRAPPRPAPSSRPGWPASGTASGACCSGWSTTCSRSCWRRCAGPAAWRRARRCWGTSPQRPGPRASPLVGGLGPHTGGGAAWVPLLERPPAQPANEPVPAAGPGPAADSAGAACRAAAGAKFTRGVVLPMFACAGAALHSGEAGEGAAGCGPHVPEVFLEAAPAWLRDFCLDMVPLRREVAQQARWAGGLCRRQGGGMVGPPGGSGQRLRRPPPAARLALAGAAAGGPDGAKARGVMQLQGSGQRR